ncbi:MULTISPECIES: ribosome small subunit-dependent GTPase A [Crateriforma]|uniref:Small ribosomal subunit biogenesis GTPase RsgA n=1 Tax=Crateriforma conspicua TaxID=2527996 RepID=A0A5C6FTL0_9PLAN|nr:MULTISPECIES: ribosome small subunit-dependent GTPase A [Crateriforma]TWU64810.1 putative ribosome biogenesis GTPase RsgA [Crateriforma conspicua]
MPKKKHNKLRADFRKKHQGRVRDSDLTRRFQAGDQDSLADAVQSERLTGKGDLTRKRTVIGADSNPDQAAGLNVKLDTDSDLIRGRVVSVHGLKVRVIGDDGRRYECAVRQLLKSLSTDQRHVVVAGDRVTLRAESPQDGMIESVLPRRGVLSRSSRGKQHVIVANVDYVLIIASVARPSLKPALIDRFLLTAAQCEIQPIIVFNKCDLIDPIRIQPIVGVYASMGYRTLMVSAETEWNIDPLRALLTGKQAVLAGQSGVGKSSLLNRIQPGLGLAVGEVSDDNDKGRHTTTASRLIPTDGGGAVFDTPGIRQFQLWNIEANEVGGLMPDFRPYVSSCRYPDCLHLTETDCAVKDAVADARIDARRYDAYCHLLEEDLLPQ